MGRISGVVVRVRKPSQKPNYWKGEITVYWDIWFRRYLFFSKMVTVRIPLGMDLCEIVGKRLDLHESHLVR